MRLYGKTILLLILPLFLRLGFGQCSGCNVPFNFCDEILANYNYCSSNDIDVLEEMIILNSLNIEWVNLGYQEWFEGRLKTLLLINNEISQLPISFGELSGLEGLDLEFNSIITLPESIGNLYNLRFLDLSSNQIKYLPDTFFDLYNLKTLGLYNNQLSIIQSDIGLLSNLDFINLSFNQLIDIPKQICKLENLNWSENWIDLNYSYLYNNNLCPPYPYCIEDYVGEQNTLECTDCPDSIEGDINYDGYLNILDIITVVNCILSNNCNECIDINYSGSVDILDIISIINIILNN